MKNKMSKLVALLAVSAMVCGTLVGCGSTATEEVAPVEETVVEEAAPVEEEAATQEAAPAEETAPFLTIKFTAPELSVAEQVSLALK